MDHLFLRSNKNQNLKCFMLEIRCLGVLSSDESVVDPLMMSKYLHFDLIFFIDEEITLKEVNDFLMVNVESRCTC